MNRRSWSKSNEKIKYFQGLPALLAQCASKSENPKSGHAMFLQKQKVIWSKPSAERWLSGQGQEREGFWGGGVKRDTDRPATVGDAVIRRERGKILAFRAIVAREAARNRFGNSCKELWRGV